MVKQLTLLALLLLLSSCGIFKSYEKHPKREFRGVWIATVVNIDWPKNGADSAQKQKADYLKILPKDFRFLRKGTLQCRYSTSTCSW